MNRVLLLIRQLSFPWRVVLVGRQFIAFINRLISVRMVAVWTMRVITSYELMVVGKTELSLLVFIM